MCSVVLVSSFHFDVFGISWFSRFLDGRAISAVLRVEFFRKLSCWFSLLFARFLLSSGGTCLATLCFSISSCRDDVARVAGLLLQGRCKVIVRVCVVSLSCCFMSSVVSSLSLLFAR